MLRRNDPTLTDENRYLNELLTQRERQLAEKSATIDEMRREMHTLRNQNERLQNENEALRKNLWQPIPEGEYLAKLPSEDEYLANLPSRFDTYERRFNKLEQSVDDRLSKAVEKRYTDLAERLRRVEVRLKRLEKLDG